MACRQRDLAATAVLVVLLLQTVVYLSFLAITMALALRLGVIHAKCG